MISAIRRGWLIIALFMGLVVQFFQFFRSQAMVLTTNTLIFAPAEEGVPVMAQPQVGVSFGGQQPIEQRRFTVDIRSALEKNKAVSYMDIPDSPPSQGSNGAVIGKPLVGGSAQLPARDVIKKQISGPFDASTFNYSQPVRPTIYTLPPPKRTNQSTVVICMSARGNFERRAAIRDTWAKDNDNVYFVIGGPLPGGNEDNNLKDPLSMSSLLFEEQKRFGDLIDVVHPDTYRSLPFKLHAATTWVVKNLDNLEWIVKADDDAIVRVQSLQYFVLRKMNPFFPQVIGTINVGSKPHRNGKWAEDPKYTAEEYPPWAFGSAGYVFSRPIAQYLADHQDLYYYQGEDAGLGIWLNDSPLQVTWIDTPEFRKDEGCLPQLYIIGHDLSVDNIYNCFGQLGDELPERKHIIAFSAGRKDQFRMRIKHRQ